MKLSFSVFLLFISLSALAANQAVNTVMDYLRETPAYVSGSISMDENMELYKTKVSVVDVGLRLNARKGIGFSFSDQHLSINTGEGLSLTIAGVPIKITSIYYHASTGKFQVKTDTFLGIGEETLNKEIEKVLDKHYRAKVVKAFNELKTLKSKNSLQDANQVIKSVAGIFSTGKKMVMPTIRGDIELGFTPRSDRKLKLDKWNAEIKANDRISAGVSFVKTKDNLTINGVEFRSNHGIRFSGETKFPEIASLNFQSLQADRSGIRFNYDIGAEEILVGFQLLIGVVAQYSGHPSRALQECDPIRLKYIRDSIDSTLRKEISNMIRNFRPTLLKGGASPQLLAALE